MRDVKRRIETYSFYDRSAISSHLEAMAAKICRGRTLPMESLKPLMQKDIEAIYRMCL